ncbi:cell agglutination protein Mam3 [Microbotryomycetes sp. JL221]|nr:cell agglutination protein Mam3 [Microbotryomycetes sp. JL221]
MVHTRRHGQYTYPVANLPTLIRLIVSSLVTQARAFNHSTRHAIVQRAAQDQATDISNKSFVIKLTLSIIFVLLGGCFSGLTLGLMGLDNTKLQVLAKSGTAKQQYESKRVLSLMSLGFHWVLSSLLVSNVIVNETLPVFLDDLTGGQGWLAVLLSSSLIVVFGEILPQAVCARHGLSIGSRCIHLVKALMYIEAPITWPVAKCLDYLLGREHGTLYRKIELKTLLGLHGNDGSHTLSSDEVRIVSGLLDLGEKTVGQIMTPIESVFSLTTKTILTHEKVEEIVDKGHSRIPVRNQNDQGDFVGMLMVKKIVSYDPDDEWAVDQFELLPLPETRPDLTCLDALNFFLQGNSHMLLVTTTPGSNSTEGVVGVVSLEDVVEELLMKEIIDETDQFVDVKLKTPVVRSIQSNHLQQTQGHHVVSPCSNSVVQDEQDEQIQEKRRSSIALVPLLKGLQDRRRMRGESDSSMSRSNSPYIGSSSRFVNGKGNRDNVVSIPMTNVPDGTRLRDWTNHVEQDSKPLLTWRNSYDDDDDDDEVESSVDHVSRDTRVQMVSSVNHQDKIVFKQRPTRPVSNDNVEFVVADDGDDQGDDDKRSAQ